MEISSLNIKIHKRPSCKLSCGLKNQALRKLWSWFGLPLIIVFNLLSYVAHIGGSALGTAKAALLQQATLLLRFN